MNWFKALQYVGVAMGFIQNVLKAFADGRLTLTEGLGILKQVFIDLLGPGVVDNDAVLLEEDQNYIVIKLNKALMNNIQIDLTQ